MFALLLVPDDDIGRGLADRTLENPEKSTNPHSNALRLNRIESIEAVDTLMLLDRNAVMQCRGGLCYNSSSNAPRCTPQPENETRGTLREIVEVLSAKRTEMD